MGGGRAMATSAAKVVGIGVAKGGGFRGGFGYSTTEQFRVKNAAASKSASASISSAVHPSVEEDAEAKTITPMPVWDDWEFAGVDEEPIPRVVFSKPPSLEEAKEATEDLKEAIDSVYMSSPKLSSSAMDVSHEVGSVSKLLSGYQGSENRVAVESAVPQVALQAFAFLSENTAAQNVVASIASDPKVWDAVMENKDLMRFLETKNTETSPQFADVSREDDDDHSEHSSADESEVSGEAKPMEFVEILQDIKLKAVRMMENVSSYFGGLFGLGSVTEDSKEKKPSFFNDTRSIFGLAVVVIFMVVLKRA
ncbi:unnamed protein product [Cochlearia groenlandica]